MTSATQAAVAEPAEQRAHTLAVERVSKAFGGLQAVNEVSLTAQTGQVTAVIGPNGAGKSTLLNLATGFIRPDTGTVRLDDVDVTHSRPWDRVERGMARTFQDLEVFEGLTVAENVAVALRYSVTGSFVRSITQWRGRRAATVAVMERAISYLEQVGLATRANEMASNLAYGEQKLLIVARLLATECPLLLFDEPGAGLPRGALDDIGRIFRHVARQGRGVLVVDHNMKLIFDYADHIFVLHHGELIFEGTPEQVRSNEQVVRVYLAGGKE